MHVPRRRRKHFGWETFTRIKNDIYIHVYTYKRRIIPVLVRLRYSCWGTRSLLSVIYLFLSLTGGTPRKLVRHHRSGVQKKQDDTRRSSNGPRTRTPPTYVITAWQAKPDLKTINFNEKRFSDRVTQLSIIR